MSRIAIAVLFRESEIEELYLTPGGHQDVRRFQIAMNDAFCVSDLQSRSHLQGEFKSFHWGMGRFPCCSVETIGRPSTNSITM